MVGLKLRVRFNPGRTGAPMDKLGEFATQTEKFLRSLTIDLGVAAKKGHWLATHFTNGSVEFDTEFAEALKDPEAIRGREALELILGEGTLTAIERGLVSFGTVAEFSRIGKSLNPDDYFMMGVYGEEKTESVDLKKITYRKTAELRFLLETPYVTSGTVQGVFHSWHPGADVPFFNVRELSTAHLVRCEYAGDMHTKVHQATKDQDSVVMVYGTTEWDKATNLIVTLKVTDIEPVRALLPHEFEMMAGSAPNFTGAMSTDEYISWIRGDED